MLKWTSALLAIACLPAMAQAHEVWVERDGAGPARIYLGEPGDPLPEGGDPEFEKLKARVLDGPGRLSNNAPSPAASSMDGSFSKLADSFTTLIESVANANGTRDGNVGKTKARVVGVGRRCRRVCVVRFVTRQHYATSTCTSSTHTYCDT